eukprot:PLAT1843.2.p1 GENE.PLAT1843.2~~PLAT1843.2.p1  ORF type:complete len:291 (+),score=129.70 PLAT1843.2:74-946(+)
MLFSLDTIGSALLAGDGALLRASDPGFLRASAVCVGLVQLPIALLSAARLTDKLEDFTWAMSYAVTSAVLLLVGTQGASLRQSAVAWATVAWAVRLGFFLLARILKMGHDWRLKNFRKSSAGILQFWMLQAVFAWVNLLPISLLLSVSDSAPLGLWDVAAVVVFVIGWAFEWWADAHKSAWKAKPSSKGRWIMSGPWKYSQYPNYFGTIALWFGLALPCVPVLQTAPLTWKLLAASGPVIVYIFLVHLSGIPFLARRKAKEFGDNPEYAAYCARTNVLLPMPPRARVKRS